MTAVIAPTPSLSPYLFQFSLAALPAELTAVIAATAEHLTCLCEQQGVLTPDTNTGRLK